MAGEYGLEITIRLKGQQIQRWRSPSLADSQMENIPENSKRDNCFMPICSYKNFFENNILYTKVLNIPKSNEERRQQKMKFLKTSGLCKCVGSSLEL